MMHLQGRSFNREFPKIVDFPGPKSGGHVCPTKPRRSFFWLKFDGSICVSDRVQIPIVRVIGEWSSTQ